MGGAIAVESVEGEGSSFYFTLPVDIDIDPNDGWDETAVEPPEDEVIPASQAEREEAAGREPAEEATGSELLLPAQGMLPDAKFGPLRILIAEDHPVNQKLLLTMLRTRGYTADLAENGRRALEAVLTEPYDLVFMDVQMPLMSGLTATARIRQQAPLAHQPYIAAVTAYVRNEDRERCFAVGMDDFIGKPFLTADIERVLQHCQHTVSL